MAIKMRVLCYPEKKKLLAIGNMIKAEYDLNVNSVDRIPPAYSCENERLVILAISGKGEPDDMLRRFCSELNKKKAQNVALLVDGDEKMANRLLETLRETGTNVMENVKFVKLGGLPFLPAKVSDEEKAALLEWAHAIVDAIQ